MLKLITHKTAPGIPLVLLHGFPMDSGIWQSVVEPLSVHSPIITVDLPGFGSAILAEPFTIASLAVDLHQALSARGLLPCILGGLSMGGYIAMAFAERFADDLAGLILIDTKAAADDDAQKRGRDQMIELAVEKGSIAVAGQMLTRLLGETTRATNPACVALVQKMMSDCPVTAIRNALLAMRDRADQTAMLAGLATPTLIVVGEEDTVTPVSLAEQLRKQMPDSRLSIIRGSGHLCPIEQPEQVVDAVLEFARSL